MRECGNHSKDRKTGEMLPASPRQEGNSRPEEDSPGSGYPGLYIHVPFCRGRCGYCSFFSTTDHGRAPRWLDALKREIEMAGGDDRYRAETGNDDERVAHLVPGLFDTLYIGGGTPSSISPGILEELFRAVRQGFRISDGAEITVEANPADLNGKLVEQMAMLGVNRVSLGAQSFDDRVLALLGRRHRSEEIVRAMTRLRRLGVENLSLDLIYGVPGQSFDSWIGTLERALQLEPDHLSCYQLTLETATPLGLRVAGGEFTLPGEEAQRKFFVGTSQFLARHGYEHYEISNFARSPKHRSRHNQKYWNHSPYLGLGPAAHSFDGRRRWWNPASLESYCRLLESGKSACAESELLTAEQRAMETVALGLRISEGFELKGLPHRNRLRTRLGRLRALGLVQLASGRVIPTIRGFLLADSLALELCR